MSNLTIDECKRIISKGRKQLTAADDIIAELESENDELREAWLNQAKTIYEQIMRIRELESLVRDMCQAYECGGGCVMYDECQHWNDDRCPMEERITALGIEVD